MDECLRYFQGAIERPDSVPAWDAWWGKHAELVRAHFDHRDYLRLKLRKLDAAREILKRMGLLGSTPFADPLHVFTQGELHGRLPPGDESDWIPFTQLPIVSGNLRVSDAGYFDDEGGAPPTFSVSCGRYRVLVKIMTYPPAQGRDRLAAHLAGDRRVSRLRVALAEPATLGQRLDYVGVDHALVAVFDPSVAIPQEAMNKEQHKKFCAELNVDHYGVVHFRNDEEAVMPVVASGFGDGGYPIHELLRDGNRVGVEVVFIGPEVLVAEPGAAADGGRDSGSS
ncbi:MAG TPA: DUF4241 domain-containing protein [Gemmataceae bacterium]|nr:DUF4241 domain-containing protein [Gemmataceae bacterium]